MEKPFDESVIDSIEESKNWEEFIVLLKLLNRTIIPKNLKKI
jgi:hypothetical protein